MEDARDMGEGRGRMKDSLYRGLGEVVEAGLELVGGVDSAMPT